MPNSHTGDIATTDTSTPLSDHNAPNPPQPRWMDSGPLAPQFGAAGASARHSVKPLPSGLNELQWSDIGTDPSPDASVAHASVAQAWGSSPTWVDRPLTETPPEPVWPSEPTGDVQPPQIPDWGGASLPRPDARWEHASVTTLPRRPDPSVRSDPSGRSNPSGRSRWRPQGERSRVLTAAIVLTSFVVILAVVIAVTLPPMRHATNTSKSPATAAAPAVTSADVARMRAATENAIAATKTARTKAQTMDTFPTPTNVAAVINPYVAALELYSSALTKTAVPEAARTAALSAVVLVTRDEQFLDTINGLPSIQLGSYLQAFLSDTAQLQTSLTNLLGKLHTPKG